MRGLARLPPGIIFALITLGVVVAAILAGGGRMFSAGPLNTESRRSVARGGVRSHAETDNNCSACHVSPWSGETMASRCLNCHTDVRDQLDAHGPLHGRLAGGQKCRNCHTEHKGPHAALTSLAKFDHDCA